MAKIKHVKAIIRFRRATEAEWADKDPVLRLGEPALSTDKNKVKIGDGKKHWSQLEYTEYDVDEELDDSSTNPVQNKVIAETIETMRANMPKVEAKSTDYWNGAIGYVPAEGEIVIYNDYDTIEKEEGGEIITVAIPGIKIGDGLAYVQDLPFIDEKLRDALIAHVEDVTAHTTLAEKLFWNKKLNVDDESEVIDDILILNRN